MAATYQLDKILHCVQDDKGLIYHILILPNTYGDNTNNGNKNDENADTVLSALFAFLVVDFKYKTAIGTRKCTFYQNMLTASCFTLFTCFTVNSCVFGDY